MRLDKCVAGCGGWLVYVIYYVFVWVVLYRVRVPDK